MKNGQKLGVLFAGLGSISSTLIAGVEAIKKGLAEPIGSQALLGRIALDGKLLKISELLPLTSLSDMVFGGWDIYPDSCLESAKNARVLNPELLEQISPALEKIKPYAAVFDRTSVKSLKGSNVKKATTKREWVEELRKDIRDFKKKNDLSRVVVVISTSTESYVQKPLAADAKQLKADMDANAEWITPSVAYALAAIEEGAACINATPSIGFDAQATMDLAKERGVPLTGKDLKTGQTMLKTVLAPALKVRMLGLSGWYSTNILGNRDGEVLADPDSNKTKIVSKQSVLSSILDPKMYPELYGNYNHQVRIDYYPPRGDNKEAWDNIDIFGWLGYPMQIKVNFLCRDSILAAPLLLDLILFSDLAKESGLGGVQEWLSLFHKSPIYEIPEEKVHDLFRQFTLFEQTLAGIAATRDKKIASSSKAGAAGRPAAVKYK